MHRSVVLLLVPLVAACAGGGRFTRNPEISHDPKAAHAEADRNGDGYVDVEEFHQRITEVYFHGDKDKDGAMAYTEMDEMVVFREDWSTVDSNANGQVSLHEFVRDRMLDFEEIDADDDGLLSADEVETAYKEQGS